MEYKTREYPLFSACGLNCGLCPRYYTAGSSRCPGCGGEGFLSVHCSCSILPCCERKGINFCFECDEFPCKKYKNAGEADSFISHKNQFKDMGKAKRIGIEAYMAEQNKKIEILQILLKNYDDGRRKSFFCTAINLLEVPDIEIVMDRLNNEIEPDATLKEKASCAARLFNDIAEQRGISLKLRKNVKH